jgi:hypothetical protein
VIQIFAYHRVDHYPIAGQTFLDNTWRQRRTPDSLFFTSFTGARLALGHPHEILSRFDTELFRRLVADRSKVFESKSGSTSIHRPLDNTIFKALAGRLFPSSSLLANSTATKRLFVARLYSLQAFA